MKKILTLLLFFFIINFGSLYAQVTFAAPGAEWHNSMNCGVLYSYYSGDTVISGISCRKIARLAHMPFSCVSMGIYPYDLPTLCVYNNSDTVFVYNHFFNRFTPLYVFNVSDGDTVTIPILPTDDGQLAWGAADSVFSFIVDSVREVVYDTTTLKTVYTRSLGLWKARYLENGYAYSYGQYNSGPDTLGAYAERIGSVAAGIIPVCLTCGYIVEEDFTDSLRCYSDSTLSVKLTADSCDIASVSEEVQVIKQPVIAVFPNPATTSLIISSSDKVSNVAISNLLGQVVITKEYNSTEVQVCISALPAGLYFVKVNGVEVRRFVKQ